MPLDAPPASGRSGCTPAALLVSPNCGELALLRETSGQIGEQCNQFRCVSRRGLLCALCVIFKSRLLLSFGRVEALGDVRHETFEKRCCRGWDNA